MSLDVPIGISQQAKNIQAVLAAWAIAHGGVCEVVSNLKDLWAQAAINNDLPRILVCYAGETARGSSDIRSALNRVDRIWNIGIIRGRGFSATRGDSLVKTVVNAMPFYDAVEWIRDETRNILNISEEFPVEFISIKPLAQGTMTLDGYLLEILTANDIPAITYDVVLNPDPPIPPPEVPINLGIEWDDPINYTLTWYVSRAPASKFTLYFSDTSGGPYITADVPPASGNVSYLWQTNPNHPETPASGEHLDMYLVVVFDDGGGVTASSAEFHGVWSPPP